MRELSQDELCPCSAASPLSPSHPHQVSTCQMGFLLLAAVIILLPRTTAEQTTESLKGTRHRETRGRGNQGVVHNLLLLFGATANCPGLAQQPLLPEVQESDTWRRPSGTH